MLSYAPAASIVLVVHVVLVATAAAQDARPLSRQAPAGAVASTAPAGVVRVPDLDAAAVKEQARRLAPLSAKDRVKLVAAGRALRKRLERPASGKAAPLSVEAQVLAVARPLSTSGSDADVMAIAFLVLMEAAKSSREDLKAIMAQVKAIDAAKQCSTRQCVTALKPTADYDAAALQDVRARVGDKLDSLSEMGEMESLRLQMAMDRLSKMLSTISNVMKKMSETSQSIIQSLK